MSRGSFWLKESKYLGSVLIIDVIFFNVYNISIIKIEKMQNINIFFGALI